MLLLSLIDSCYYHFTTTITSSKIIFVGLFIIYLFIYLFIICFVLFYLHILLFIRFEVSMYLLGLHIRIIYYLQGL